MPSGDLYDSAFGKLGKDVFGGSVKLNRDGSTHTTVFGDGGRFSWDTNAQGQVKPGKNGEGTHFTDQGFPLGNPHRHPFGR